MSRALFVVVLVTLGLPMAPPAQAQKALGGKARGLKIGGPHTGARAAGSRRAQERARATAVQLLKGVLDRQLSHLRQNNLQEGELYREIDRLRRKLSEIVDRRMDAVLKLLVRIQETDDAARQRVLMTEAVAKMREIVLAIAGERQLLARRLQLNRMLAQATKVLELQVAIAERTNQLDTLVGDEAELALLNVAGQQRTNYRLYLQLVETMTELQKGGNDAAAQSQRGMEVVRSTGLDAQFANTIAALSAADVSKARQRQRSVVSGLRALLNVLRAADSSVKAQRGAIVRELLLILKQQQGLRTEVADQGLRDKNADELSGGQSKVGRQLAGILTRLPESEVAAAAIERAQRSAVQATEALFQLQRTAALKHQDEAIRQLAAAVESLQGEAAFSRQEMSADDLADAVGRLQELHRRLLGMIKRSDLAQREIAENATTRTEERLDLLADQLNANSSLARDIRSLVRHFERTRGLAKDAARSVKSAMAKPSELPSAQRMTREFGRALQELASRVAAKATDVRRMQLAVKVGELARATEALERAAAAQRQAADELDAGGTPAKLAERQRTVSEILGHIADGVRRTASEVSTELKHLSLFNSKVSDKIAAAPPNELADSLRDVAVESEKIAQRLREMQQRAAQKLSSVAEKQINEVENVQRQVGELEAKAGELTSDRHDQPLDALRDAVATQQTASGRAGLGKALRMEQRVRRAQQRQQAAIEAAERFERGESATPLQAIGEQRQAASVMGQLVEQSRDAELGRRLQAANKAATQAAQELLGGDPQRARSARRKAAKELAAAQSISEQLRRSGQKEPPGGPDAGAQGEVSEALTSSLRQIPNPETNPLRAKLQSALNRSRDAQRSLKRGDSDAARGAQEALSRQLAELSQAMAGQQKAAAGAARTKASQIAKSANQLAELAARVDPAAAAALRESGDLQATRDLQTGRLRRNLKRSQAGLLLRRQELQQDQQIGQAMAKLADDQKQAREQIVQLADQTQRLAGLPEAELTKRLRQQRVAAARNLQGATKRFADAQRATGEGAVQVSGQQEVVNPDIRKALKLASGLAPARSATAGKPGSDGKAGRKPGPGKKGTAKKGGGKKGKGKQGGGKKGSGKQGSGKQGSGKQGSGKQGSGKQGSGKQGSGKQGSELGTGLVPKSPEATAQQIAGAKAMKQAERVLQSADAKSAPPKEANKVAKGGTKGKPDSKKSEGRQDGKQDGSQPAQPSDADVTDSKARVDGNLPMRAGDARFAPRNLESETWFARLPPTLRNAIRSSAKRRPPRGYEERLRRYFEDANKR